MGRMVVDGKVFLDQAGHTPPGPDLAQKPVGFGTLREQLDQLCALARAQQGRATGYRLVRQHRGTVAGNAGQPLTDRPLGHSQSGRDARLGPVLLVKCPRPLAATLAPTAGSVVLCGAHNPQQSIFRPTTIRSLCSYL